MAVNFGAFECEAEVSRFSITYDGPQVAVQVKNHVTFGIAFGQGGPAAGLNAIATLRDIGLRVVHIIGRLTGIKIPAQ